MLLGNATVAFVHVIAAAQKAINTWGSIVSLLSDPASNVTAVAEQLAPIYLPTYHAFDFGTVKALNQSDVLEGAAAQFQHMRDIGIGTNVELIHNRIEAVSNESAICWMTLYLCPPTSSHVDCWSYTEPFGFRLFDGVDNGLGGGWEWGIGDQEFLSIKERFPDYY